MMAMLLQGFATRLGLASGRDLSQACRDAYPRPVALCLWVSAELAMVATDLAEVIGFAVALSLLTGLPTGVGVGVAVFDTFLLLALPAHTGRVRTLEVICAILVTIIFVCFATELGLAKPNGESVLLGYVPNSKALGADGALLIAIGILGATVMPHNLYLHSALVRTRMVSETLTDSADTEKDGKEDVVGEGGSGLGRTILAAQKSPGATSSDQDVAAPALRTSRANIMDCLTSFSLLAESKLGGGKTKPAPEESADASASASTSAIGVDSPAVIIDLSSGATAIVAEDAPMVMLSPRRQQAIRESITLGLTDSAVSLALAFLVNSAILIVAGSAFSGPVAAGLMDADEAGSLSGAYRLLAPALGAAAPTIFGIALLASGQSSTLTGTMAGQVVMEGFLNIRMPPMLRRLLTRALAIIPAAITVAIAGDSGLDHLLVLSQVVLSFQLPFAVVPLVSFASNKKMLGEHAIGPISKALGWLTALFIICVNLTLVVLSVT